VTVGQISRQGNNLARNLTPIPTHSAVAINRSPALPTVRNSGIAPRPVMGNSASALPRSYANANYSAINRNPAPQLSRGGATAMPRVTTAPQFQPRAAMSSRSAAPVAIPRSYSSPPMVSRSYTPHASPSFGASASSPRGGGMSSGGGFSRGAMSSGHSSGGRR
jgi:hypothetical protein